MSIRIIRRCCYPEPAEDRYRLALNVGMVKLSEVGTRHLHRLFADPFHLFFWYFIVVLAHFHDACLACGCTLRSTPCFDSQRGTYLVRRVYQGVAVRKRPAVWQTSR